jgi:IclR family acetate operon transcriptional repressor
VERGWFEGNAEFTSDLGGVALPLKMPHRHFAVLVAGPMFRIQSRAESLAATMEREIGRHVAEPEAPISEPASRRKSA